MLGSSASKEKRALQIVVGIASMVPIAAGAAGALFGPLLVGDRAVDGPDLDSHFRYLSGLLLGIGVAYACTVPGIERQRERFLLLGGIVVLGGCGRLLSMLTTGEPSPIMIGALAGSCMSPDQRHPRPVETLDQDSLSFGPPLVHYRRSRLCSEKGGFWVVQPFAGR